MEGFTNFLANNYVWFLIISLILVFALIGYLVDLKEIKSGKVKKTKDTEMKIVDFSKVDKNMSLNDSIKEESNGNLNLDDYVKQNESKNDEFVSADKLTNMNFDSTTPMGDSSLKNNEINVENQTTIDE